MIILQYIDILLPTSKQMIRLIILAIPAVTVNNILMRLISEERIISIMTVKINLTQLLHLQGILLLLSHNLLTINQLAHRRISPFCFMLTTWSSLLKILTFLVLSLPTNITSSFITKQLQSQCFYSLLQFSCFSLFNT